MPSAAIHVHDLRKAPIGASFIDAHQILALRPRVGEQGPPVHLVFDAWRFGRAPNVAQNRPVDLWRFTLERRQNLQERGALSLMAEEE